MSAMPATHGHSAACCNIPPVVETGYKETGSYEQLGGFNTYTTGSSNATKGLLFIFDIFGFYPQTLQGADILGQKYRVLMPDWFEGKPADISVFPPDTPEKKETLTAFLSKNHPAIVGPKVKAYVAAASAKYPAVTSWAIVGFCWGGKVVSNVTSTDDTPFKVGAEVHPAMVDAEDAKGIKVPLILLASKDEDAEEVKKFEANLKGPKYVETYGDQIHGWMAARSNLSDPRNKEEYARGYKKLLEFFGEHL
ncbi:putative AIM2 family protein C30D10.14 [Ceratocystis fimbriata CBS 114723]|uniref:Putative AIM2 family protein C30D10.14 n=1 Tax=Ceratocystis fimbriata CBS 114723 TaxID=1035309 RepID=A0A2C5WYB6_9PEZI|nr:putative AIM2 family protein C30D10.14 [Ceratocystis fimbriata CBS 114723]